MREQSTGTVMWGRTLLRVKSPLGDGDAYVLQLGKRVNQVGCGGNEIVYAIVSCVGMPIIELGELGGVWIWVIHLDAV